MKSGFPETALLALHGARLTFVVSAHQTFVLRGTGKRKVVKSEKGSFWGRLPAKAEIHCGARSPEARTEAGTASRLGGQSGPASCGSGRLAISGMSSGLVWWHPRATPAQLPPVGRSLHSLGQRVGAIRPLPGGERAIVESSQGRGCLELTK
jgi:hypothetical protein